MNILILARMSTGFAGDTIYQRPLGGSESALLYLSRELARIGHKVIIFNNCGGKEGNYEGVEYRLFTTLADLVKHSKEVDYDVFISFRDLPAFLFPIRAKKRIWWGHDDFSNVWNYSDYKKYLGAAFLKLAGFLINRYCDMLFVVSKWLGEICTEKVNVREEKIYVTKNGVYLPYFLPSPSGRGVGGEGIRDPYRLVYTSVPARGLDILLDLFPEIKKQVPQATLHIYCGWDLGMLKEEDKIQAQRLYDKTNQPGVVREGTKKHSELAKELLISSIMLYPSHAVPQAAFFAETSCIAALEAQAAGCPVIASNRGALSESIIDGKTGVLINGDPYSKEYRDAFVRETVTLLNDRARLDNMRADCINFIKENYTWEIVAKEWISKFESLIQTSPRPDKGEGMG